MEQELRSADGKLYGVLRDGRWLEFRRGERVAQFDLAVFAWVREQSQEQRLIVTGAFDIEMGFEPLLFVENWVSVERIRSTE